MILRFTENLIFTSVKSLREYIHQLTCLQMTFKRTSSSLELGIKRSLECLLTPIPASAIQQITEQTITVNIHQLDFVAYFKTMIESTTGLTSVIKQLIFAGKENQDQLYLYY